MMNIEVMWRKFDVDGELPEVDSYSGIVDIEAAGPLLMLRVKDGFIACYNIAAVVRVVKVADDVE